MNLPTSKEFIELYNIIKSERESKGPTVLADVNIAEIHEACPELMNMFYFFVLSCRHHEESYYSIFFNGFAFGQLYAERQKDLEALKELSQ